MGSATSSGIDIFTTCPPSNDVGETGYLDEVSTIARWSEEAGCRGILVYSDNRLVDPWIVSHTILQSTSTLIPLVAVQPLYMHPFTVAKLISTFANLLGRSVILNMVAGGFKNDLVSLDDPTPHDERYDRVAEYSQVIQALCSGGAVNHEGTYYRVRNLKLTPAVPEALLPGFFVSGSSEAGLAAARAIGATAVKYPQPPEKEPGVLDEEVSCGIRVGIIARETEAEAWTVAHERFPADRRGQIAHAMAMQISDSRWHRQLSDLGKRPPSVDNPYWLHPFENYKTFCPYLVGSYDRVAGEVARYVSLGFTTFILDIPPSREELEHTRLAMDRAVDRGRPVSAQGS